MKITDLVRLIIKSGLTEYKALLRQRDLDRTDVENINIQQKVLLESKPVFVLSTGRCGTQLLTNLFELNKECDVYHSPKPEFTAFSSFAYKNYKSNSDEVASGFLAGRYEMIRDSFLLNQQYIETNNRITFLAYQIAEIFPSSKFIHLIRKPESFIKSGLRRNWYLGNNLYDEGRAQADIPEWNKWKREKKIAWLWNETNTFINSFKTSLDDSRIITVKAEDLYSSSEITNQIFEFCELEKLEENQIKKLIRKPVNASKSTNKDINVDFESLKDVLDLKSKYYP